MTPGDARALIGQRFGAYQIEALLPIGGLPECFKAYHVEAGREVAIKLLPGTLASGRDTLAALRTETRHISALKHPNILPIYGIAETGGMLYAVTPLPTESLRDQLNREGVLPAVHAVRLAAQLAWALHALHGIGLIHGDVQPGTLLFDATGTLQVADFCVARALARQRGRRSRVSSRTWPLAGARTYVAPEAAQSGEISIRGDIYALGAVLYEMLIGTLPLQQEMLGEPELVTAPLPPSMRSSDTWPELAAVALKALDRDPAKRYPDARAFAIALRRAVIEQLEAPREPSLRDALVGVWHPEAEEAAAAAAETEAFKKRLTMPPAPSAPQPAEPSFREKLATAPPILQSPQSRPPHTPTAPATPAAPAARQPRPPDSFMPPRDEDIIGTTLLPDRPIPTSAPRPEPISRQAPDDDVATTLLPDRPTPRPEQPSARSSASFTYNPPASPPTPLTPPMPAPSIPPPPSGWQGAHPPLRLPLEPLPPNGEPALESSVSPEPPAFYDDVEYVSPEELAQALAGRRPGKARRFTAAVAGMALLLAFGAGTVGILTGFGRGGPGGPSNAQPPIIATSTVAPATATVIPTATPHPHAATVLPATMQPTLPPPPPHPTATATATPRPTATPTATPTPTATATPNPTPTATTGP